MLRKDTKKYKNLCEDYATLRDVVEHKKIDLEKYRDNLDISSQKYEELKNLDDIIKEWYNSYVNTYEMLIGLSESTLKEQEVKVKGYEYELVNDYGDDVDEIYEKYRFRF